MSAVVWWGYPRTTSGRVYVRPDSDGTLSAACNGRTYTGTTALLADGEDRVGYVDITGQEPNSRSDVTIMLDGVTIATASLRTAPSTGADFKVVVLSCQYSKEAWIWDGLIDRLDPVLIVFSGDNPYCEQPDHAGSGSTSNTLTGWGETVNGISAAATNDSARQACLWSHQRLFRRKLAHALSRFPSVWIKSDHDGYPANNWDRTLGKANAYRAGLFADLAAVDDYHSKVDGWLRPYWQSNPPNASAGRDLTRDEDAQLYWSLGIGNLRIFATEHYTYQNRGSDSPRYQLGATQENWLYAEAAAATEPMKLWTVSPGAPWLEGADEEKDRIFEVIGNSQKYGWVKPGGWANVHGDIHAPFAQYDAVAKGDTRTLLRVNSSPCGTGVNPVFNPEASGENTIYSAIASTGSTAGFYWTICSVSVDGDGRWMDLELLDERGNSRFGRRILAGSNEAHPLR